MLWSAPVTTKLASPVSLDIPQTSRQEQVYTTTGEDEVKERRQEAGTITDLHNSANIAEVEIISLLEEKVPLYKLRADTATGYAYDDWLGSSLGTVLEEGDNEEEEDDGRYDLSPEMMEETLKYFTLCGDRVVQMTKTYNDIDAVTRLLEEKEKDLELAAKIGQSLLQQNKQLDARIETLEEQVTVLSDQNTQLRHDIKLKNELLQIYTNDIGYSDSEDDSSWSERSPGKPTVQSRFIDVDTLQKKVRTLEEENLYLRIETADLRTTTTSIEEKEEQLMHDCVKQLGEAQGRESILGEELSKKYEENARQQEEITNLLAQVVDLQNKVKKLTIENEEMQHHLQAARESQQDLTDEVQDLRDKYDECHEMLLESQEAVKEVHRRSLPQGKVPSYSALNPLPVFPLDSLAAELVNTVEQELGGEPHLTGKGRRDHQRRVMRTAKAANKKANSSRQSSISDLSVADLYSMKTSPNSSLISLAGSPRSEQYEGDNESTNSPIGTKTKALGKAGIPGSNDLETALRRLSLRRQNNEAERKYKAHEKDRLLTETDVEDSGEATPTCTTPGSMWSSDGFGYSGYAAHNFKAFMPEKLQIVKPMEGSMTLYHWQRLATPHMASMLDNRPGVVVKGFREIDTEDDIYSLDDVEDDGMFRSTIPSKCFVNTSSTYTYTTSNIGILDNTNLSSGTMGPRMTSTPQISTSSNTRARSTSTFSTSIGLAQVLQERETPKMPSVRTKAEASSAPSPRKANLGLNFFSAGRAAEKKAEMSTMPGGVHQVRRGIISRNATPVLSKTAARVLDPETKERLMEKVKAIRAEKQQHEFARRLSMSEGIHTTRTSSVTMSSIVSRAAAFKTGVAPGFCDAPSGLTMSPSISSSSSVQPSNNALSGLTMSTSTLSSSSMQPSSRNAPSGLTMSTSTLSSSSMHSSSSLNPAAGAIPKASSLYSASSASLNSSGYSSSSASLQSSGYSSSSTSTCSSMYSSSASPYSTHYSSSSASPHSSVYPSSSGSPYSSSAMSSSSSSLLLSSSSSTTRTSVLPPPATQVNPPATQVNPPSKLPIATDNGVGLAALGSLGVASGPGIGLGAVGSLEPPGGAATGLASIGSLDQPSGVAGKGVGLAAVGALSPVGGTAGLASIGSLDQPSGVAGKGLGLVGALSPAGSISRATAGTFSPQSGTGAVGLAGALSPQGTPSPLSVLSGGNLSELKNRLPTGRRL